MKLKPRMTFYFSGKYHERKWGNNVTILTALWVFPVGHAGETFTKAAATKLARELGYKAEFSMDPVPEK